MERYIVSATATDPVSVLRHHVEGPWVLHAEAQAAIDAANKRAENAELLLELAKSQNAIHGLSVTSALKSRDELADRLALAVAELKARRRKPKDRGPAGIYFVDDVLANNALIEAAVAATDADPVLAKMIGGGE